MFIYVLKCPVSGEVRYVGKAKRIKDRLRQHIHEAQRGDRSHKCAWIRKILRSGGRPIIAVDRELAQGECWKAAERERIAFYREQGYRLTNATQGGDGEGLLPDHIRDELSRRASLRFGSPEGRKRQSETMKRLCSDPAWLAERSATQRALRSTPEWKAAQSARSKALWDNPEYRARMKAARAKVCSDPEFRKRLSESNRKAQASAEVRRAKAEKARAAWARPEVRERQLEAMRAAAQRRADGGANA